MERLEFLPTATPTKTPRYGFLVFIGMIALPPAGALLANYVAHRCGASETLSTAIFILAAVVCLVAEVIAAEWMEERHCGNKLPWSCVATRILSRCRD